LNKGELELRLSQKGFTLTELLVIIAIVAVLATVAIPNISRMLASSKYREAAREIASTLQNARTLAVSKNLEHRVEFTVSENCYQLQRGDKASHSTTWTSVYDDGICFKPGLVMRGTSACDNTDLRIIEFNPNGTSSSEYICVLDDNNVVKHKVAVTHSTTGRVVIDP